MLLREWRERWTANSRQLPVLLGGAASMWLLSRSGALAQEEYGYESALEIAIGLIIIIVVLLIYFIPSIVAFRRRHPNRWPIFLINLLFGGTGLGWLGSLIWALQKVHISDTGSDGGESGLNIFANDPTDVRIISGSVEPAGPDPTERLRRLKALHDEGALSKDEYDALRKPLLRAMGLF